MTADGSEPAAGARESAHGGGTGDSDLGERYILTLAYNGGCYRGFQKQNAAIEAEMQSVSGAVEATVLAACGGVPGDVKVGGYSRTDAGTHALHNACLVWVRRGLVRERELDAPPADMERAGEGLQTRLDQAMAPASLNAVVARERRCHATLKFLQTSKLGDGVVVDGLRPAAKRYTYTFLHAAEGCDPAEVNAAYDDGLEPYVYRVVARARGSPLLQLDVAAMQECVTLLHGSHDFRQFQKPPAQYAMRRDILACSLYPVELDTAVYALPPQPPARPICEPHAYTSALDVCALRAHSHRLSGVKRRHSPTPALRFDITGSGFLRCMVRKLAFVLSEVGRGTWTVADFAEALTGKKEVKTVLPARGLVLADMWWATRGANDRRDSKVAATAGEHVERKAKGAQHATAGHLA